MFDISFSELALIGVIALLVVGPEKLPGMARTAGVWVGKARRMVASVKADVDRELKTDELRKLLTEQKAELQELRHMVDDNRSALEADIHEAHEALTDPSATASGVVANPALAPDMPHAVPGLEHAAVQIETTKQPHAGTE